MSFSVTQLPVELDFTPAHRYVIGELLTIVPEIEGVVPFAKEEGKLRLFTFR